MLLANRAMALSRTGRHDEAMQDCLAVTSRSSCFPGWSGRTSSCRS
ncbi:hypothetical protein [Amycolatopsis sp. lyj-346]